MKILMKGRNGDLKEVKVGFSWTTFFFGCIPAFTRGDWKWGFIMLILALFTAGLSSVVLAFFYNKIYLKNLIEEGYRPANAYSRDVLIEKGFIAPSYSTKSSDDDLRLNTSLGSTMPENNEIKDLDTRGMSRDDF